MRVYSTREVSERTGISQKDLMRWQREGYLTPVADGDGRQRRLQWSEKDIAEAVELRGGGSRKSNAEAIIDALGGQSFMQAWAKIQRVFDIEIPSDQVVFVGPKGSRVLREDEPIHAAISAVGNPAVMLTIP